MAPWGCCQGCPTELPELSRVLQLGSKCCSGSSFMESVHWNLLPDSAGVRRSGCSLQAITGPGPGLWYKRPTGEQ